jgi:hypothetical protein
LAAVVVVALNIHHCQAAVAAVEGEMDRLVEHLERLGKEVLAEMVSKALVQVQVEVVVVLVVLEEMLLQMLELLVA